MKTLPLVIISMSLLMLTASTASATRIQDGYIYDKLDEWTEYAEDLDYYVIDSTVESIRTSQGFQYELEQGTYHVFAEGDQNINDLDMVVYDSYGFELGSDYLEDNFPYVSFELDEDTEVEIIIYAYGFNDRRDQGDFCFVLAVEEDRWDDRDRNDRRHWRDRDRDYRYRDDDYRDENDDWDEWDEDWDDDYWQDTYQDWNFDFSNDWRHDSDRNYNQDECYEYAEDHLYELMDYAYYQHMDIVMDDISDIEDTESYEVLLDRGTYVVFASGDPWISDLDLHVYDPYGDLIAEDIETDDTPAIGFRLDHRMEVEIEVEAFSFNGNHDSGYYCILLCRE